MVPNLLLIQISPFSIVMMSITLVLLIAVIVLFFVGKRMDKKQAEQQKQIDAARQNVTMLIIDKKDDVVTLRNLGASDKQIVRIFLFEGRLISAIGAVIGIILGLSLCWAQQAYGFVKLGSSSGSFIINAYPVSVHPEDVILIFITVLVVGFLSVWYPVHYFAKRLLA